jgi:hypothetical protein
MVNLLFILLSAIGGAGIALWYVQKRGAVNILDDPNFNTRFYSFILIFLVICVFQLYFIFSDKGFETLHFITACIGSGLFGYFLMEGHLIQQVPDSQPEVEQPPPPPAKSSVEERLTQLLEKNKR